MVDLSTGEEQGMNANAKGDPQRVAPYFRVSTDEQAKSGYSIPDQRRILRERAASEGWTVVEEIADDGYSGASPDRPGVRRIYELAEAGEIDAVIATKRDRYFRSRYYRLEMDRHMKECRVTLVSLTDTGNRIGDGVMDDFAEWEREQIADRTRNGKLQKARAGMVVGGHNRAYGYDYVKKRRQDRLTVVGYKVNEAEMATVRHIFSEAASGAGIRTIKEQLDAERIPTPGRGKTWSRPFLKTTVLSDLYRPHTPEELRGLGVSDEVVASLDGSSLYGVYRYDGVPVPIPDAWIPLGVVLEARRRVGSNTATPSRNAHRFWELSGGILHCAECGRRMQTHSPHAAAGYFYYRCQCLAAGRADQCIMREMVRADSIEPKVWNAVRRLVDDKELLLRRARSSFDAKRTEIARFNVDAEKVARDLSKIEEARANYQRAFGRGFIDLPDLEARTAELNAERDILQEQLERVGRREEELEKLTWAQRVLEERIREGYDNLDAKTPEERREIYRDVNLRVDVGLDKVPRITGLFPLRSTVVGSHSLYVSGMDTRPPVPRKRPKPHWDGNIEYVVTSPVGEETTSLTPGAPSRPRSQRAR